jgi:hypothetical protein
VGRVVRRKDEHGLRQVELARDRLHLLRIEPARIRNHRQRIAAEDPVGEDVGGVVADVQGKRD